jgi:signal transduction histidine kinase
MFNMVDTILTKYKYENDRINLNKEYFDINRLILTCNEELKHLVKDKKLNVNLKFQKEECFINADIIEIKRLITNLFSNAISYTLEKGEISIEVKTFKNKVKVAFKDNGHGISKEDLKHLFNKYVSYAKRFRQIGTGLGLYVSKQITDLHNGKIFVQSEENKGSIFTFELPIA